LSITKYHISTGLGMYIQTIVAHVQESGYIETNYRNTTNQCIQLYYQIPRYPKTSTTEGKGEDRHYMEVSALNEFEDRVTFTCNYHSNAKWNRMFLKLPSGIHKVRIAGNPYGTGNRYGTESVVFAVDNIAIESCQTIGKCFY
jgi:hypothetical protein